MTQKPKNFDAEEIRGRLGQKSGGGRTGTTPKKAHKEEQIVAVLRQVEAGARVDVCRKMRISQALTVEAEVYQGGERVA